MKKQFMGFLIVAALSAAAFIGCGGGDTADAGNTPAKLAGTWRVYHTPNGGIESSADTWGITTQPGNDAALTITSSQSGAEFYGTVYKTSATITMPDGSYTVTLTGTVVIVTDAMIGYTMSGTYSSTSGETGTWRAANLAYVTLSIQVAPQGAYVVVGYTTNFTATAVYSDGYTENVTGSATWSPAAGTIATVNGGVARGWSVGTVFVNACYNTVCSDSPAMLTVISGYTLASLSGAWLVDTTADRNAGYDFFITDGSGNITSNSFYSTPGSNTYSVQSNGPFTLTITPITGPPTFDITGALTSPSAGTLGGVGPNSTIAKISDLTLCQGAWTGALSTGYNLAFTIKADGALDTSAARTITGGTITGGAMVGQGSLCAGYFTTDLADPYNAFRINGTLAAGTPTTLTGNFDNDSGTAWPVGTVSLTK